MSDSQAQKVRVTLGPVATAMLSDVPQSQRTLALDKAIEILKEEADTSRALREQAQGIAELKPSVASINTRTVETRNATLAITDQQREMVGVMRDMSTTLRNIHALVSVGFDKLTKQHQTTRGLIATTYYDDDDLDPIFNALDVLHDRADALTKNLESDQSNALARIDAELNRLVSQQPIPTDHAPRETPEQPDMIRMMDQERER